jgi:hypothetical protein
MAVDDRDPREIANEAERLADTLDNDELDDEVANDELDDEEIEAHQELLRNRAALVDEDEVEADDLLRLDRKELNELGLELDNPDGFADE